MKHRNFIKNSIVALLSITLGFGVFLGVNKGKQPQSVDGTTSRTSLPETITLKDNTVDEIRSYYASLNKLTDSERQGTNLLKHLKEIIHDDIVYYPYGSISSAGVTQIYTITDRDWDNSPASSIVGGTYNATTKTITNYNHATEKNNNPYIKMLYVDYSRNGPTRFLNGSSASFDKEHVWSQSHGFKANSGATGPAGTDLHHLIAGEKAVNQQYHSNWSYGNVKVAEKEAAAGAKSTIDPKFIISGNKLGTPLNSHSGDEVDKVFEPNDSDKGRIARALLYMAACYNNYSGHETITDFDPNLQLVDYIIDGGTSVSSSSSSPAKYGILSDLLEWNRTYLPDSFEIHRNNLIYNNYQFNRNPFIDFPEWADFIWGNADSSYQSTGYATPESDTINGYNSGGTPVAVTGVTLNTNSTSVEVGSNVSLTATVAPSNATNKSVTWTTSNSNVATVSSGVVSGVAEGNATITVTTSDGGYTATCSVTVTASSGGSGEETVDGSVSASDITSDLSWTKSGTGTYSGGDIKFDTTGDYILRNGIFDSSVSSNMEGLTITINGKWNSGTGDATTNSYKVEAINSSGNVLATQTKTGSDVFGSSLDDVSFVFDSNLTGCTGFKITYNNKGNGNWQIHSVSWQASYSSGDVPASKTLSSISLDVSETQTIFYIGDDFNYDELVVTAYYDDESSDIVGPTSVSTPNLSTLGEKNVEVSYTEGGVTKTATYQITVKHPGSTETSQMIVSKTSSPYYSEGAIYLTGTATQGSAECNAFTVTQTKDSNYGTDINYSQDELRIFANHKFLVTPKPGYKLTSIVCYANTSNYANAIGTPINCSKSTSSKIATLTPTNGTSAVGFRNTSTSWINYVMVYFEQIILTWNSPTISVFSGSTLTATDVNSWEVNDGSTTYTSNQLTITLDDETISIPHTWSVLDDGKVIKAIYNGASTEGSSAVEVIQAINSVSKETFTSNTSNLTFTEACGGSGTANDSKQWTVSSDGVESTFDSNFGKGIHYGTGKAEVTYISLTSSAFVSGNITKVEINASTASGVSSTVSVKVGDNAFGGNPQSLTNSAVPSNPYTFIGKAAADEIEVLITKPSSSFGALYCKSIVVTYETSNGSQVISNNASHKAAQRVAVKFANAFNEAMDTTSYCTTNMSGAWSTCSIAYNTFKSEAAALGSTEEAYSKDLIKYATAQYTNDNGEACIERMLKTYEVCVQKHGQTAFMSDLITLGRAPTIPTIFNNASDNAVIIIVIVSVISVSAIGGYFFLKSRRKEEC